MPEGGVTATLRVAVTGCDSSRAFTPGTPHKSPLNKGLVVQGTTIKVPYEKQVPGLPAQSGAGGGYMTPSLVSQAWRN